LKSATGGSHILDRLSAKLAKDTALHVVQVKEKYGRLKVYWEGEENAPPDPRLDDEIEAAIREAADESERTCEVCGQPGTHEERHRWWSVRCKPCDRIDDISAACERIAKRVKGLDLAAFSASADDQDAVRLPWNRSAVRRQINLRRRGPGSRASSGRGWKGWPSRT
jgi:hypothetical protein